MSSPVNIYGFNYWYGLLARGFSAAESAISAAVTYRKVKQFLDNDLHLLLDIWLEFQEDNTWIELFMGHGYIDVLQWTKPAFGCAYYKDGKKVFVEKLGDLDDRFHTLNLTDSYGDVLWKAEIVYAKTLGQATFNVYSSPSSAVPVYTKTFADILKSAFAVLNVGSEVAASVATQIPQSKVNAEVFLPKVDMGGGYEKITAPAVQTFYPYDLFIELDSANPKGLIYTHCL